MIELVVISGVAILASVGYTKLRKTTNKFTAITEIWESNLQTFMEQNGISNIDFTFSDTTIDTNTYVKKNSSSKNTIKAVGVGIEKGYDLVDCEFFDEFTSGPHYHSGASEFFYVLNGKAYIRVNGHITELNSGDFYYVEPRVEHEFSAEKNCRCIVVTLPNIILSTDSSDDRSIFAKELKETNCLI